VGARGVGTWPHTTRRQTVPGASEKGVAPNIFAKWVLILYVMILMDFFNRFLEILSIFGGSWALFEARSWGEVGRWLPTSGLYKPGLLEAMGGGSEQVYAAEIVEPKPLSCREAIEECTFAGHFWELRSSDLGAVSFDGFLRSGRT
jgi:hypothetical protein